MCVDDIQLLKFKSKKNKNTKRHLKEKLHEKPLKMRKRQTSLENEKQFLIHFEFTDEERREENEIASL